MRPFSCESTFNSSRALTNNSSAAGNSSGRGIAGADPALRETARTNRAPEREVNGIEQPENTLAGDAETAGKSLEAASLLGKGGLESAALAADQDTGMKGAAFFLAAFALLVAAAVFFTVRMRMRVKKSKDDAAGRV